MGDKPYNCDPARRCALTSHMTGAARGLLPTTDRMSLDTAILDVIGGRMNRLSELEMSGRSQHWITEMSIDEGLLAARSQGGRTAPFVEGIYAG